MGSPGPSEAARDLRKVEEVLGMEDRKFNVGDIVIVTGRSTYRRAMVERLTPKGFVEVTGLKGTLFYQDGRERNSGVWRTMSIKKATPESEAAVLAHNRRKELIAKIRDFVLYNITVDISLEDLEKIAAIINEREGKKDGGK